MLSPIGFLRQTTNSLLAQWSAPPTAMNQTNGRLHPLSPKGSIAPKEPDTGSKGVSTLSLGPTTLDLMSDLVGGSADFDPIPYLGYSFVRADAHNIPHKTHGH